MSDYLDLYDYRRRVAEMYQRRNRAVRTDEDGATILQNFREERDKIFAHHAQSALDEEQRRAFTGLSYFPYNPALSFRVEVDTSVEPTRQEVAMNAREVMTMTTVGHMYFTVEDTLVTLALHWLDVYGGGLFLPFHDATCPAQSYGGGRYLFDTIKGSDFAGLGNQITLDFNYAYNPSCAYNDRWVCPLAPRENRLPVPIRAGEKKFR